ncbi:MAG: 4'-phosphopantetheinyl transferase family protein [Methanosarcina sp.]
MKTAGKYSAIGCCADPSDPRKTDVYFSETSALEARFDHFRSVLSADELLRADQLHFNEMRQTFVISHGLLRLILGKNLGMNPSDIIIQKDDRNKPYLKDHSLYFNLSHTKNAFAIAICRDFQIGIDLEEVNPDLDYASISGTVLNYTERMYVEENRAELYDRFFLLWTRKEAYLKGVGSGITCDLSKIASFQKRESLAMGFPEESIAGPSDKEFFVYSEKIMNYFISIASPGRIKIQTNIIDEAF